MRLLFRQKMFSWFDSYDIYDEDGGTVYTVQGRMDWGHRLEIYDTLHNRLGMVREKVLSFLPRFDMYIGERQAGSIHKELTLLKPRFTVDCNGWRVCGDIMGWNYSVENAHRIPVLTVEKQIFRMTDTYVLDVVDPADTLLALMVVIAIDAARCSGNK